MRPYRILLTCTGSCALCSLPRTNPGNELQYRRVNGPFGLYMVAGANNKLPYGNIPRLLMVWMCSEATQRQSPELFLGDSLSGFLEKIGIPKGGGPRTRLREQMSRFFNASVSLIYEDRRDRVTMNTQIADLTEFWWNERRPRRTDAVAEQDRSEREVFQRDHQPSGPAGHEHPEGPHPQSHRPGPVRMAQLPNIRARSTVPVDLAPTLPAVRPGPGQCGRQEHCPRMCCNFQKSTRERRVGLTMLLLMQPLRTAY